MSQVLDIQALHAYLQKQGLCGAQSLEISALSGGQSNPTYRIQSGNTQLVLRKQPPGQLLAGAHAVDREYHVMKALDGSGVPVPRMLDYCEDRSLLVFDAFGGGLVSKLIGPSATIRSKFTSDVVCAPGRTGLVSSPW